MKKLVLVMAVVALGFTANAQDGFRIGANIGIPSGDASDFSSFFYGLDVDYDFNVSEGINVGLSSGYAGYSGKDDADGFNYIPIAGSVDFEISDGLSAGGDLGIAVSTEDGGGSDFMYRFQLRYQASDEVDISGRFNSISGDGFTWSNISVGVGYRF